MLSRTQIINDALRMIAANSIAEPDEDTESARQAKAVYDKIVRAEIEAHPWGFAKTQAGLAADATAPLYRFAASYTLPSDFIRLVEFEGRWAFSVIREVDIDPSPIYEIQGRSILTDTAAPLNITYLRDLTNDPTLWPPLFANCVSAALAQELAMTLTKSEGMVMLCEKRYQKEVRRARQSNAIQMPPQISPDGSWLSSRVW